MTYPEKVKALRALLEESVRASLAGDKVTALQLSGGLDSAVIQAIAGLPRLYCCTWPEFDNLAAAERVACGKPVRPVTFSRSEMIEVALPVVARLTEGKGTWSQCCQWFMAREMAADGVQVELNGEGADELFGGYARYRILWWLDQMMADPHLAEYGGIIKGIVGDQLVWATHMLSRTVDRKEAFNRAVRFVSYGTKHTSDGVAVVDELFGLAELIDRERLIAWSHGLEHRWPFMAAPVVQFAHTLTEADKITVTESKHILRDVARSLGVHTDCVDEVTKRGLVVPPTWAPAGSAKWSRGWFEKLMAAEWQRQQEVAA